ncbi:MAG: arginase [Crocinitomicaceae bacterium]|nr:arginase [Crocinitomicaceae bacterium]MDP4761297.1 arginase [Crocinitomicaceae bacterium]
MNRQLQFIFNPSELGAGTRGASLGPEAIRAAARTQNSTLFSEFPVFTIPNRNDLLDRPTNFPFAKRIDGVLQIFEGVKQQVKEAIDSGMFPLIIAGDHSSAGGTMAGLKLAYPGKRLGVLWIDAHADIHSPYTTPSGNIHGMPIATALGVDQSDLQKNSLDLTTMQYWNQLKSNALKPSDLIYIGVRDVEEEEIHAMKELNLRNYTVKELRDRGLQICIDEIKKKMQACDIVYVSFDVDSMDPSETSYGTGTPVPEGISFEEAKSILTSMANLNNLACMEIVEVNPCLDNEKNRMAEQAFDLINALVKSLK